jgi:hypothetical protein
LHRSARGCTPRHMQRKLDSGSDWVSILSNSLYYKNQYEKSKMQFPRGPLSAWLCRDLSSAFQSSPKWQRNAIFEMLFIVEFPARARFAWRPSRRILDVLSSYSSFTSSREMQQVA